MFLQAAVQQHQTESSQTLAELQVSAWSCVVAAGRHPKARLALAFPGAQAEGGVLRSSCPSAYSRFVSSPTHLPCHLGSQRQASWPLQAAVQQQQAESSQTLRVLAALQQSTAEELSALHDAAVDGDVEGVSGLQRAVAELHHATDEERRQRTAQQQVRAT